MAYLRISLIIGLVLVVLLSILQVIRVKNGKYNNDAGELKPEGIVSAVMDTLMYSVAGGILWPLTFVAALAYAIIATGATAEEKEV